MQDELKPEDIGHEEGAELENEHGIEVIVYDKDEDGKVIGWHKELKKGKK